MKARAVDCRQRPAGTGLAPVRREHAVELTAFWMIFFDGYIDAPPTITVCSEAIDEEPDVCACAVGASAGAANNEKPASSRKRKRVTRI